MTLATKLGVLLLAIVACWILRDYALLASDPTELADLTVRQMENSAGAAEALRVADAAKNWLAAAWPALVVGLLAACLFWDDATHWLNRFRTRTEQG
jgi:hypothetical protein